MNKTWKKGIGNRHYDFDGHPYYNYDGCLRGLLMLMIWTVNVSFL